MNLPLLTPAPAPPATERAQPPQTGTRPARWWRGLHWLVTIPLVLEAWLVVQRLMGQVTRPLWYDEQWRAYHFSLSGAGFWTGIREANAPLAGGWVALEKLSTALLGNREVPLRLPGVIAYLAIGVATYALARRFLGTPASFLVAAGVVVNASILEFSLQLKPFGLEVLAAELAVLLWLDADRPGRGLAGRLARYAGMGLCAVAGTAVAFVVGPLLLVDAGRLARERALRRLLPPLVAGAVTLVHLKGFVLLQTRQTESTYWDPYFLPRGPLGDKLGFTLGRLAGFVPRMLVTDLGSREGVTRSLTFGEAAASMLAPFMAVALALGVVAALRSPHGRALLAVLVLSLDAQLVASSKRLWPFGFVRTNLFLVPFAYLLAGMGVAWLLSTLRRLAAGRTPARSWLDAGPVVRWAMRRLWALWLAAPDRLAPLLAPGRVRRLAGRSSAGWPAAVALVVAGALAVNLVSVGQVSVGQMRLVEGYSNTLPFGAELRGLARVARLRASPTDLAVHVGDMTTKGWAYYMRTDYDGYSAAVRPGPAIPPERTITTADPARLARFLASHPRARSVFVVIQRGEAPDEINQVYGVLRAAGYSQVLARYQLGPSMVLQRRWAEVVALDLPDAGLRADWKQYTGPRFLHANAHALPFEDHQFDLVVAVEVLEHLHDPVQGLREIARVGSRHVVLSVPREPIFRSCNLVAGRYVKDLGNTPGHLN